MARNGSGTFVRAHDFTDDAAAAIKIRADRMDEEIDGIATALSASIANDGQTTILADLPMGGFKHTGVGNATARNQYATVASLQDGSHNWVAAGGTADAITATYAPALTALVDGQECKFRALGANTVIAPTFAPNGLTAHAITKRGGSALAPNDIPAALAECILRYNLANTRWELQNPASGNFLSTTVLIGAAVSLSSNVTADVGSLVLPPGDWEVWGTAAYGGTFTGATHVNAWLNTASATIPAIPNGGAYYNDSSGTGAAADAKAIGQMRVSVSVATTIYLSTNVVFSGTATAYGFIGARRVL